MILNSKVIGESSSKLIILHGFLGMSNNWKTYANKMQETGFEIHLLDQRNHGESFHSIDFNYEIMAKDILDYLNHNKISKASLIGHSMGGKTAMMFSSMYPEFIEKLIVVDILPIAYKSNFRQILECLYSIDLKKISSRKDADELLKNKIKDFVMRGFLLKNLKRNDLGNFNFKFNLEVLKLKFFEVEKALKLKNPFNGNVLFIKGEKSNYVDLTNLEMIEKNFPKFKIVEIPKAGHWVHSENPEMFFNETNIFLKN